MPAASAPSAEPRSRAKHSQPAPPRKEVTVKSDLYSLGLVLYEIFTGKRPFEANTLAELVRAQSETMPVSPTSLVRDMDPVIERVILRCLDPDPARRPSSALADSKARIRGPRQRQCLGLQLGSFLALVLERKPKTLSRLGCGPTGTSFLSFCRGCALRRAHYHSPFRLVLQ